MLRRYDPEQYQQFLAHKDDNPGPKSPIGSRNPAPDYQLTLYNLRDDIKGEMEAVILYESAITTYPYQDIQNVLRNITIEEKGHAEHLTRLLLKYDPDTYDNLT